MISQSKNNNIKTLMQKHDLTIETLAHELNLSVSTINRLLMGSKSDPKLSTLKPLAKFFGVTIDELVGERPINLKPGDDLEGFDHKNVLVQVPILHWEQIKSAELRVPTLNFEIWNNWTVANEAGENSYALIVKQSSLPPPFYYKTIIVIDPIRKPLDSDYVLVLDNENPILCKYILNGIEKCYQSLHLKKILRQPEIKFCGTIVQWMITYQEKMDL